MMSRPTLDGPLKEQLDAFERHCAEEGVRLHPCGGFLPIEGPLVVGLDVGPSLSAERAEALAAWAREHAPRLLCLCVRRDPPAYACYPRDKAAA